MKKAFTLVEIMIVVAVLGLLIALGVPGFLNARNKAREKICKANIKSISDNIASYNVNQSYQFVNPEDITFLWPGLSMINNDNSYIRKQLHCPASGVVNTYAVDVQHQRGSCLTHGTESDWH